MKVIFLDIDGVLNTGIYLYHYFTICKKLDLKGKYGIDITHGLRDEFGTHFDPKPIQLLKWIVEVTGAKIVISSTWRLSGLETLKEMWASRDLPGEIIDITPFHKISTDRGYEIQEWLKENQVEAYVIIDDDSDMLEEQLPNFVQTDSEYGITYTDAQKCVDILNKE